MAEYEADHMSASGMKSRRALALVGTILLIGVVATAPTLAVLPQEQIQVGDPGAAAAVTNSDSAGVSGVLAQEDDSEETEPNDNRSNADRISTGSSVTGSGFINGSDVDWYAFNVTAGNAFNVAHSGPAVNVSVYDPAGNLIRSESPGTPDTWSVGGVADQSGTYYVRVNQNGAFSYGITIKTASPDQFEQNDDQSAAASIEPNQQLDPDLFAGEQDWYAVEADSGQNVTAVVERLSGALDPGQNLRVDIFNEDGELVSEPISNESFRVSGENKTIYSGGTDAGEIAKVNVPDTQSGTYYVRISGVEDLSGFIDYALTTNTGETTAAPDGGENTTSPTASVVFENQTSDGTTMTVDSVTMSEGGFVAIHNASLLDGDALGSVVGVSEKLPAGTHEDVEITLFNVAGQNFAEDMALEESGTLIAMPHLDSNGNGMYDFITSNGTTDSPYTENGSAVVDPGFVTIENGTADEAADDETAEPDEADDTETENETVYYQIDFVQDEPIENLDWPDGTYTNDQLIRFAHGSTEEAITRRSDGEFTTDETLAERIDSQEIEVENGTATVTFTVADGESVTLSLASYIKPDPTWDPEDEDDQVFVDAQTETYESGTHTLTVELPSQGATSGDDEPDNDN